MGKYGIISIVALLISSVVYVAWFFNASAFTQSASRTAYILAIVLSIFGLITALLTKKKSFKFVGLVGNSIVLLWAVIIPFASTLFWNTP